MQADSPWQRGTEENGNAFCDSIFQGASVLFLQDHGGGAAERSRVAERSAHSLLLAEPALGEWEADLVCFQVHSSLPCFFSQSDRAVGLQ